MSDARIPRCTLVSLLAGTALHAAAESTEANLARYAKGVLAEVAGDAEQARGQYEATLAGDPSSFFLACKTADFQELPSASKTLRTYARTHPEHLASQLYYADFLEQHAPHDAIARKSAVEILEQANETFPHTAAVFTRLINLHETAEDRAKSMAVFNAQFEAVEAGPEHWMALGPVAKTLLPGESPELEERLDLIAEKTVDSGAGIEHVARSVSDYYRKTGRMDEAIAVLERHLEIHPDSLDMRTRLGLLQLYAEQEEAGLKTLHETLQIDPEQVLAHRSLAQYYERNEQPEKALHHGAEVLRVAGGAPEDFLEIANQYLGLGKPHEARLLLEKARFAHPENASVAARLAIATLRDGDSTGAARIFREAEALARDSEDPAAKDCLDSEFQLEFAGSLHAAGDIQAADERLVSTIRTIPPEEPKTLARALRELVRVRIEQNKTFGLSGLLKRAEDLDPGHPEALDLREQIENAN